MNTKNLFCSLFSILAISMILVEAGLSTPSLINYQGILTNASGSPVNGSVDIKFDIFDLAENGTSLWSETHSGVTLKDGVYSLQLGSQTSFPSDLFNDDERWLEVTVNPGTNTEEILSPRQQMTSVAYAKNSDAIDGFDSNVFLKTSDTGTSVLSGGVSLPTDGLSVGNNQLVVTTGRVGIGTSSPGSKLDVAGDISLTGMVDGRDVAVDGNKLDGIAAGAADTTDDSWTGTGNIYTTSGNVGIGTTNPEANLHIKASGPLITEGLRLETSGSTLEDWYVYMNGSDDLVFRNDTKDSVTIQKNTGNVGIGTTNPTSKLDVVGEIQTTIVTYSSARTHTLTIPASAFQFAQNPPPSAYYVNEIEFSYSGSDNRTIVAPINLPHNAKLVKMTAYFEDSQSQIGWDLIFKLYKTSVIPPSAPNPVSIATISTSAVSTGYGSATYTFTNELYDSNRMYTLKVYPNNNWLTDLKVVMVQIEYQISEAE